MKKPWLDRIAIEVGILLIIALLVIFLPLYVVIELIHLASGG